MIALIRIDEKLIHGQVVVGWGGVLNPTCYVVVDDTIASDEWERELVLSGVPDGVDGITVTVNEAATEWQAWSDDEAIRVVLAEGPGTLVHLCEASVKLTEVNVGGLRKRQGRSEYLSYVWLDDDELADTRALCERNVKLEVRDLPGTRSTDLCPLLGDA